jgi:hypothetical protein
MRSTFAADVERERTAASDLEAGRSLEQGNWLDLMQPVLILEANLLVVTSWDGWR